MTSTTPDRRSTLSLLALLLLAALLAAPGRAWGANPLYSDPSPGSAAAHAAPRADAAVTSQKPVIVNVGYLQSQVATGSGQVVLPLFDGSSVVLNLTRVDARGTGSFTWFGKAVGYPDSSVVLTVVQGQVSGTISLRTDGTKTFQIRPGVSGAHWLQQLDPRAFPPDHPSSGPPVAPKSGGDAGATATTASADTVAGTTTVNIDVMIVWSNQTQSAAGSGMPSEAQHAVDVANTAYANSGIAAHLTLVYAGPVSYSESGDFPTDLNWLTSNSGVASLRNQYGADLVSMFIENTQYCGYGWIGPSASYGFTVVNRSCASGNYSYPHETGHNFGARHDPYVDPSTSPYAYGHGYVNCTLGWRTVMAYPTQCGGSRLAYFSNPNLLYNGVPMGTSASGSTPTSDNASVHNQNALTVAGFRSAPSASGCTYSLSPTSASAAAGGATSSFSVTTGAGCAWNTTTSASWLTVSSTSPTSGAGTLTYTVAANTGPARSGTITVGGQAFTLSQASGCTYQVSPGSASFSASGGTSSLTVTTAAGCTWTASSAASWVSNVSPASGTGSATVSYAVAANTTSSTRTTNLAVSSANLTVTEDATAAATTSSPVATLSATSLAFGTVRVGGTSSAKSVTLTNTGTGTLSISALTQSGSADFARAGTCTGTTSLSAGQSCTIVYTFKPSAKGSASATLTVSTNAASPALGLSGKGR